VRVSGKQIRAYKPAQAKKLHKDRKMINFIPLINMRSPKEMAILKSWERWFKGLGVPFLVTEQYSDEYYGPALTLWKERVA